MSFIFDHTTASPNGKAESIENLVFIQKGKYKGKSAIIVKESKKTYIVTIGNKTTRLKKSAIVPYYLKDFSFDHVLEAAAYRTFRESTRVGSDIDTVRGIEIFRSRIEDFTKATHINIEDQHEYFGRYYGNRAPNT